MKNWRCDVKLSFFAIEWQRVILASVAAVFLVDSTTSSTVAPLMLGPHNLLVLVL